MKCRICGKRFCGWLYDYTCPICGCTDVNLERIAKSLDEVKR